MTKNPVSLSAQVVDINLHLGNSWLGGDVGAYFMPAPDMHKFIILNGTYSMGFGRWICNITLPLLLKPSFICVIAAGPQTNEYIGFEDNVIIIFFNTYRRYVLGVCTWGMYLRYVLEVSTRNPNEF